MSFRLVHASLKMSGDLAIGLDSSTTATKATAWDRVGKAVAEGRALVQLNIPQLGWFEQAAADWWTSAVAADHEAMMRQGDPPATILPLTPSLLEAFTGDRPLIIPSTDFRWPG